MLARFGRLIEANFETLSQIVTREIGKPYAEALGEVQEIVDTCDFFLGEGRRLYGQTVPSEMPDKQLFTFRVPVGVAAIITAEDVGAYKPAEHHFRALDDTLPRLGLERSELLHAAQSLFHDHVPAKREGLPSVWINRRHDRPGWGATPEPAEAWSYDLEFPSMGAFADAVDEAFSGA